MKKELLLQIIREEIAKELAKQPQLNETYDLESVKYSSSVKSQVDKLVDVISKSSLSRVAVAAILNDIILALGLNKTQTTMYMNMIKQQRQKYNF
jgi:hypothetical protein